VLLVSHDVEEALYLSDRVLVLSPRPARAVAEISAPAPRARPRLEAVTAPEFTGARERALEALTEGSR
jgi:NitT/TauT family transport system ATP-binding protein